MPCRAVSRVQAAALLLLGAVLQSTFASDAATTDLETAYFAGGCFWCTEADFQRLDGVVEVTSGYMQGELENPTYEEVVRGDSGHTEAVRVRYDPSRVAYETLVAFHWRNIDPTVQDRQFCDRGSQYRSGIYYRNAAQREVAFASRPEIEARFGSVHTEIEQAEQFWPAEDYHQDYAERNGLRYRFYRSRCGRDARLRELWGDEAGGAQKVQQAADR